MKISWIESNTIAASGIPIMEEHIRSLHEQGIRAIVTLTELPLTHQKEITNELLDKLGISLYHFPIVDHYPPENFEQVDAMVDFINHMIVQVKPVLIHCHAGIGRTGTMLHAFYIVSGDSLETA